MTAAGILALGIDPSSSCGWALAAHRPAGSTDRRGRVLEHPTCERVASGTWQLKPRAGAHPGLRFSRLGGLLSELVTRYGMPGVVGIERPATFDSYAATFCVFGIATHVFGWAATLKIPVVEVPLTTIKRRATGRGTASKDEIVEYAARVFRCSPCTSDEADALVVARLAPSLVDPAEVF